ncbi:hypothetical protein PF002_g4811 [Phytophthora fragariae]|nr:hypothetical protein PF003_g16438 [Phytophthora fragariae]KAE8942716.1 hypothetical protein PF009_g7531 [Phytophthora fragariae]KAE9129283.1 hypothetical protein PF007_g4948 [Phytophthora fragariae]KAE9244072.1 hypothetical protein PF004_g5831 [Phytophthora fragariae]KAE9250390.1 hypothetical protein PF002_g4811 [Phytophthora fragariae]
MPTADLLRDFELLLVHTHRFLLADVVVCMQRVVEDLQQLQRSLAVAGASTAASDIKSADALDRVSSRLQRVVSLVPSFLGETELRMLVTALQELIRLSGSLEACASIGVKTLQQAVELVATDTKALAQAVERNAAVCALLTKKRDYLAKFLEEAGQVLQNSHSRRVERYEKAIEQFTEDFKLALEDEHLQRTRQLHFDIETIETSMSTMLLPHFEICRTITTANAQVQPTASFSRANCDDIDTFVQTVARLKSGGITFRSVLQHAQEFLVQLALFEQAASKDAFLNTKRKALQLAEASEEYQAAMGRLQDLKTAITRAHNLVQTSQEKMSLDDPARESLVQEGGSHFPRRRRGDSPC